MNVDKNKYINMSFSKLNTYINCPFQFKLQYIDKNFISSPNIANELGVLLHFLEQQISLELLKGKKPNYDELKELFNTVKIEKKNKYDHEGGVFGLNILKQRYKKEFYDIDETGNSYFLKCKDYIKNGIYRQEEFLKEHEELELYSVEQFFEYFYRKYRIYGYIDRIYKYKNEDKYIIDDIKTKTKLFADKDLTTPLQHFIYGVALKEMLKLSEEPEEYYYDLPFLSVRQKAGTKGFIKRAYKKLDKTLDSIEAEDWTPNPTPLCYWCNFSNTNPKQQEEGKGKCCYHSLWTKENRTFDKLCEWKGIEEHINVLNNFKEEQKENGYNIKKSVKKFNFNF